MRASFPNSGRSALSATRLALLTALLLSVSPGAVMAQDMTSEAQDLLARQVEGTGRDIYTPETAVEFKKSDNVFLRSALAVDFTFRKATVTLPMYKGMSPMGEPVFYIVTDASDFEYAKQMGLNYAPKLRHAAGTPGAQEVTVEDGVITFKGNVDFSQDYKVVPGSPKPFPPKVAKPGAMGDLEWSSAVTMPSGVVLNIQMVSNASGNHDRLIDMDAEKQTVTLSLLDGQLKVTPGLRFEHLELRHDDRLKGGRNHNTTQDVLPGLSIGYQVVKPLFLFGNYHRSFRPVQFAQITYGNELVSEKADNFELGARAFPLKWLDVGLTWFDMRFQNKLEFVDAATGFRNLGNARHRGLETSLGFHPFRALDVRLAYTYLDATQRSGAFSGNRLPYASRHEGTFRVAYRRGTLTGNVNGSCRSDAFSDAENTVEENATGSKGLVPGGCIANVHVSESFRVEETRFRVGLGVNNVLDARSFTRNVDYSLGRVPSPGRSVLVTLDFEH